MSDAGDGGWNAMPDEMKRVVRWADSAMYESEPMPETKPKVTLLNQTPDPLGSIAAACMMYEGKVVRSLDNVTDEQREHYVNQVMRTHLKAPLEFVQFHFLLEGVTRGFTHQLVRQRTATYAQESLRFAVITDHDLNDRVALPPSLVVQHEDSPAVQIWQEHIRRTGWAYTNLINAGMPAEDARGLLPHNICTRVHYTCDLRALLEHAGNRLCTQAQFEWRSVFLGIVQEIRAYRLSEESDNAWQQYELAKHFKPICYMTGKCEFKADFDRKCKIRGRVDENAAIGRPSTEWGIAGQGVEAIHPSEWLLDQGAAR